MSDSVLKRIETVSLVSILENDINNIGEYYLDCVQIILDDVFGFSDGVLSDLIPTYDDVDITFPEGGRILQNGFVYTNVETIITPSLPLLGTRTDIIVCQGYDKYEEQETRVALVNPDTEEEEGIDIYTEKVKRIRFEYLENTTVVPAGWILLCTVETTPATITITDSRDFSTAVDANTFLNNIEGWGFIHGVNFTKDGVDYDTIKDIEITTDHNLGVELTSTGANSLQIDFSLKYPYGSDIILNRQFRMGKSAVLTGGKYRLTIDSWDDNEPTEVELTDFITSFTPSFSYTMSALPTDISIAFPASEYSAGTHTHTVANGELTISQTGGGGGNYLYYLLAGGITLRTYDVGIMKTRAKRTAGNIIVCSINDGTKASFIMLKSDGVYIGINDFGINKPPTYVKISSHDTTTYHTYSIIKDKERNTYYFIDDVLIYTVSYATAWARTWQSSMLFGFIQDLTASDSGIFDYVYSSLHRGGCLVFENGYLLKVNDDYTRTSSTQYDIISEPDDEFLYSFINLDTFNTKKEIRLGSETVLTGSYYRLRTHCTYTTGSGDLLVWVNGVFLTPSQDYDEVDSNNIDLYTAPSSSDSIVLIKLPTSSFNRTDQDGTDLFSETNHEILLLDDFYTPNSNKLCVIEDGLLLRNGFDYLERTPEQVEIKNDLITTDLITTLDFIL